MKKIKLNKDYYALVDDEDYELICNIKWHLKSTGYAVNRNRNRTPANIYMHRLVNNTPEGLYTDHINRNRLDNRKSNLMTVTWSQNRNNISIHKDNKNSTRNIDYCRNRWRVRINQFGNLVHQSIHRNLDDAIKTRDMARKSLDAQL
jgi:hypothetical protein